jgi:LmbE family N-acetylglucosaminyl deacetylase
MEFGQDQTMLRDRQRKGISRSIRSRLRVSLWQRGLPPGPVLVDRAPADRVAVLAPHPDDDVIGCGGTLYKHRQAGEAVTAIYLTDGSRGNAWASGSSAELAAIRRREAEEAARVLGVKDLAFLDYPDGELPLSKAVSERVLEALQAGRPQCVFLPSLLDDHPDHRTTNRIFASLARRLDAKTTVFAYEVWTPLTPNRLVDISGAAAVKEEAIRRHASQIRLVDYAGAMLGLNRFRSLPTGCGRGFCEAFLAADAGTYAGLVEEVLGS